MTNLTTCSSACALRACMRKLCQPLHHQYVTTTNVIAGGQGGQGGLPAIPNDGTGGPAGSAGYVPTMSVTRRRSERTETLCKRYRTLDVQRNGEQAPSTSVSFNSPPSDAARSRPLRIAWCSLVNISAGTTDSAPNLDGAAHDLIVPSTHDNSTIRRSQSVGTSKTTTSPFFLFLVGTLSRCSQQRQLPNHLATTTSPQQICCTRYVPEYRALGLMTTGDWAGCLGAPPRLPNGIASYGDSLAPGCCAIDKCSLFGRHEAISPQPTYLGCLMLSGAHTVMSGGRRKARLP
ncbi:hypothetical protein B0J13DRAFT_606687 [Dactylonectria estremocensis]|uniref:Uncharacterized protein n=1 Tax=Dactylonectria estremocensis TaxID=1079267 RepID=A0A9P9EXD3_9HYPO|nr:hypothetical protein B0J13DRAFT_606687 [Dactylonectria estremocensis]